MSVRFGSRLARFSLGPLLGVALLAGCSKDAKKPAENLAGTAGSAAPSPPVDPEKLKQSYAELKTGLADVVPVFGAVRKRVDALPPALAGLAPITEQLDTAEKVLGVTDAKARWLAGELDSALKTNKQEALQEVSRQVASTNNEVRQLSGIGMKITHELGSFERTAALLRDPSTSYSRTLPSGYALKAAENGLEHRLLAFLQDPKRTLDKKVWFEFDRLSFPNAGSKLDTDYSSRQLKNVVEILKAYPALKLKIGGYVEAASASAPGKKLASERTLAVKKELVALGAAVARLDADGKSADQPTCAATEASCKAKLGRIAARITAK